MFCFTRLQTRPVLISYEFLIWSNFLQILLLRLSFLGALGFFWLFLMIAYLRVLGLQLYCERMTYETGKIGKNMYQSIPKCSVLEHVELCLLLAYTVFVSLLLSHWEKRAGQVKFFTFQENHLLITFHTFCAYRSDCNDLWNWWNDFSVMWPMCGEVAGNGRICFNNWVFIFYVRSLVFLINVI